MSARMFASHSHLAAAPVHRLPASADRKPDAINKRAGARQPLLRQDLAPPAATALADEHAGAIIASFAPTLHHPSAIRPANLVPALQSALGSLNRPGTCQWDGAVLPSPLLLGLLSWAVQLLEAPQSAAALGPEAPLLVLEALSHLASSVALQDTNSSASRHAQHCRRLWAHAQAALGDAADEAGQWTLHQPDLMTPDMLVRYYEACARAGSLAGAPTKSRGLGLLLRSHLFNGHFTTDGCVRLLAAWAQLRRQQPFNPDPVNYARVAAAVAASAERLTATQLLQVAVAAPAFEWPTYRSSVPLLHAVCRQAIHRSLAGSLPLPVSQRTLAAAVKGVAATYPRLAHELQAATIEWMRDAPLPALPMDGPLPVAPAADECNNAVPRANGTLSPVPNPSA